MIYLMAIDTSLHFHTEFWCDRIAGPDVAMASLAVLLMARMTEKHKIRQRINRLLRNNCSICGQRRQPPNRLRILDRLPMTHHALRHRREPGPLARRRFLMAVQALDL